MLQRLQKNITAFWRIFPAGGENINKGETGELKKFKERHHVLDGKPEKFRQRSRFMSFVELPLTLLILPFFVIYTLGELFINFLASLFAIVQSLMFGSSKKAASYVFTMVIIGMIVNYMLVWDNEISRAIKSKYNQVAENSTVQQALASRDKIYDFRVPDELRPILNVALDNEDIDAITTLIITDKIGAKGEGAVPVLAGMALHHNHKIAGAALHSLKLINTPEAQRILEKHGWRVGVNSADSTDIEKLEENNKKDSKDKNNKSENKQLDTKD